jgi:hypothetical protein
VKRNQRLFAERREAPGRAWRTSLLEERESEISDLSDDAVVLHLGPHEIATVEVAFSSSS